MTQLNTMKAYVIESPQDTSLEQVRLMEIEQPQPNDDQVLIAVHAVGLNPVDYKLVEGGNSNWTYPHVLGLDVAGEIVEVGSNVHDFTVGMRVSGHGNLTRNGCFAQYVVAPTYQLAQIPDNVSYETAAGLLCSGLTAYQTINRKPNLNNVRTAFIHGGSGGVGSMAIQFAKLHGLTVFTDASSAKKDFVAQLNPDVIIDYRNEDEVQRIAQLTDGLGVDLIIDTIGREQAQQDFDMLAYNGQLVTIVAVPPIDPSLMFGRGLSMQVVNLGGAHESGDPRQQQDLGVMNAQVLALASEHKINPMIERVLEFDQLVEGLRALKNHEVTGKLVVRL